MTGVAAFVVFALAIGVFAIPALRMNGQAGAPAGVGLQPLWPARTTEDLERLQGTADAGEAAWATDPMAVAEQFGKHVMGWDQREFRSPGARRVVELAAVPSGRRSTPARRRPAGTSFACDDQPDYETRPPTGYPTTSASIPVPDVPDLRP